MACIIWERRREFQRCLYFRPMHLKAAVEAGKNVFMEKPAAVDAPGVKTVIETVIGTAGTSNCKDRIESKNGQRWRFRERERSPYRNEHEDLIASIRSGNPINEAQAVAESTMPGIYRFS